VTATDPTRLFLIRSKGEKIIIGEGPDAVVVEVTRITKTNCTLTLEAPAHVVIDRAERRFTP